MILLACFLEVSRFFLAGLAYVALAILAMPVSFLLRSNRSAGAAGELGLSIRVVREYSLFVRAISDIARRRFVIKC